MAEFATPPRTARLRARGQLTIPQDIREAMALDDQANFHIFRMGRALILTPERLERAPLARAVEKEMKRAGVTLDDLITDLRGQRERYVGETGRKD